LGRSKGNLELRHVLNNSPLHAKAGLALANPAL
jgi:hypothetical protein